MDMSSVFTQMGILVIIMLTGFVCAKLGVTGPQFNKSVTGVVTNVLLSCTILSSAMTSSIEMSGLEMLELMGVSALMLIISGIVGVVTPRLLGIRGDDRGLAFFMVMMMNSAFVAFPVIETVYGPDGVLYASLSNIPFNMVAYSVGTGAIRGGGKIEFKKMLTLPLIATAAAMVIMAARIQMPGVVAESCAVMGKATVPMSMLIIGTSLGGMSVKDALSDWRVYILSFVRLIVCPVLTWLVLKLFISDPMTLGVFTLLSSAPVAMLATVFAIQFDKNELLGSRGVFISTVLSAFTMPLIIWLLL